MSTDDTARPAFLLVHGAWHGSWCWEPLTSVLHADGWETRTVDLPSAGRKAGVQDDARVVLEELARIDGPVVVVAHSYGGVPVTQAVAEASSVAHIVYLAAYQLELGESVLGRHGAPVPPDPDGFRPVPDQPVPLFYADAPEADAEAAAARLVPQSTRSFTDTVTAAGWHTVPSTYIVCEQDRALSPRFQEDIATRAGAVHRLADSHSPFLSMPGRFAALLTKIVQESAR
ncbi:alpha/beta fold hydrolase [Streptomyces sp. NPDC086080]|uniref:alpha/beta fold hydrolase n=1 Tax=Streptomyces sp. NPDC086080 TaxID=3365748 RepID=UPI0037D7919F